jgi:hypothetical protein
MCLRARLRLFVLLVPACVLLASVLPASGQTQECKKNQYLFHEYNAFFKWSRYYCKECEWGKYGSGGQCYGCPYFFTRERRYKDAETTLWCANSCALMFDNRHTVTDVIFEGVENVDDAEKAVFQYDHGVYGDNRWGYGRVGEKFEFEVCKACAAGKFMMKLMAQTVLTYYRADLVAMKYSEADLGKLTAMQGRLQDFTWSICSSCPEGFVKADKWFLPPSMVEESTGKIAEIQGKMIPCSACSVQYGVPQQEKEGLVCKPCLQGYYQLAREVSFIAYSTPVAEWNGNRHTLVVGVQCQTCPRGQQVLNSRCRGLGAAACCSECSVNQIKGSDAGMCQRVDPQHVAQRQAEDQSMLFAESGGTHERACVAGEWLVFCYDGVCYDRSLYSEGWKTCLPCSLDSSKRASATSSGCTPCSKTHQHVVDEADRTQCKNCDLCHELSKAGRDVHLKDLGPAFAQLSRDYTVSATTATCSPLQRRTLLKTIEPTTQAVTLTLSGLDYWRDERKETGELAPDFHFIDREGNCTMRPCSAVCKTRFQYSDGCGNSIAAADVWVQSPAGEQQYKKKFGQLQHNEVRDVAQWKVLAKGNCQFCQACSGGWYNAGCNNYASRSPQGECRACKSSCPKGFFLWHPEQDAGCHEPPAHQAATDNSGKFQILYDYTCKQCPSWVIKDEKLWVVAACGLQQPGDTYAHFKAGDGELRAASVNVADMAAGEQELAAGVRRKNFRTFVDNLKPYCPTEFFFDSKIAGCGFVRGGAPLELPGQVTVQVGYEAYNPKCCQPCTTCEAPLERKDMNRWRKCDGADIEDVQKHCVEKCVIGYWEATATKQCNRCSSCYEGVLS